MKAWNNAICIALLLLMAVAHFADGGLPSLTTTVDRVTYVYEKDDGGVPEQVGLALVKLNSQGIVAVEFEDDTVGGDGQVPDQFKVAKEAATEVPMLVVQAGDKVVRVVKSPTTEAQVLEAAK